ncbi:MAG: hypothetical protein ACRD23_20580 [Terriglobales bacterium]
MATATLVNGDIEIGREIVAALTRASIPVTVYLWALVSEDWLFIVATPLVDSKGPLAAYGEVNRALQQAGIPDEIAGRRIFLMSPDDRELKLLEKQSKSASHEGFRVVNASIAGRFVEDAYVYTGSIHIVQLRSNGTSQEKYSIVYAPYRRLGGVLRPRKFEGIESIREFLTNKLHIDEFVVAGMLKGLSTKVSASIPNVQLKRSELERLGLA